MFAGNGKNNLSGVKRFITKATGIDPAYTRYTATVLLILSDETGMMERSGGADGSDRGCIRKERGHSVLLPSGIIRGLLICLMPGKVSGRLPGICNW